MVEESDGGGENFAGIMEEEMPINMFPVIKEIPHQRRSEVQLHLNIIKYRIVEPVIRQIICRSSSLHIVTNHLETSPNPYIDIPTLAVNCQF